MTNRYLLPSNRLACTALDLYAARCGLLHTFTPNSKLSSDKKVRRICYAWGDSPGEDLERTINLTKTCNDYAAVKVEDLFDAWRDGILIFTNEISSDRARNARVVAKATNFFSALGSESVTELLDIIDKQPRNEE